MVERTEGIELLVDARAECGEGPIWDQSNDTLLWVDTPGQRVHRYDPRSGRDESFHVGQPVGSLAVRASGGLVLAVRDGFAAFQPDSGSLQMLAEVETDQPRNWMNDGKCDRAGRFWAGTMALDLPERSGSGALYRLDAERHAERVVPGASISNGLGWSPDDRLMYYVDSPTQHLDVFDYDAASGAIENRRTLAEIPADLGLPDGLSVDVEGYIWLAIWGGWRVRRYAPDGTLDREIMLPVSQVSSCTFGGPDLTDLYITSATETLSPEALQNEPHAGAVFRYRPGVAGLPPNTYAG